MENDKMQDNKQGAALAQLAQQVAAARASGGIANLAAAFVAAKEEIANPTKNRSNPHFGNDYATLDAVLGCFTEAFTKNGLALIQAPGELIDGNVTLVGLLVHKSGESIQFRTQLPLGPKATAQAAGSVITYARRYQAAAIAGVSQVDDDGQAGSEEPNAKKGKAAKSETTEYQGNVDALAAEIDACTDLTVLEGSIKPRVKEAGDKPLADRYVAKRAELKAAEAKKGAA